VHTLGHRNPEIVAEMHAALDRGLDGGLWMMPNAEHLALQDALAASVPGSALCRSVLTLSASASNVLALPFAFRLTGGHRIVAFRHGYHGHARCPGPCLAVWTDGVRWCRRMAACRCRISLRLRSVMPGCLLIDGRAPRAGELFAQPALAHSLRLVAEGGREAYYQGDIAREFAALSDRLGGCLTCEDLAASHADIDYRGMTILECPPNGEASLPCSHCERWKLSTSPCSITDRNACTY
jgi:hypothetical protein